MNFNNIDDCMVALDADESMAVNGGGEDLPLPEALQKMIECITKFPPHL